MDLYLEVNGSPSNCQGHKYRRLILELGQPKVDVNRTSIQDLQDLSRITFYPTEVTRIFERSSVNDILSCGCLYCKASRTTTPTERYIRADAILNEKRPCKLVLAVLIYLARTDLIHDLIRGNVTDTSPHPTARKVLRDKYGGPNGTLRSQQTVDQFSDKLEEAWALFHPVRFSLNQLSHEYGKDCRFPFLDDQGHASGSFGEVRKFNIHPDFLDDEITKSSWFKDSGKVNLS